jgi:hypothetical protein
MSQIVERFASAVQTLVGDGPVKDRLTLAYCEYLEDLQQIELPIRGKSEFSRLHSALHSVAPVGKIDRVRASVRKMSPGEAGWHAQTIVRLYGELLALGRSVRPPAETLSEQPADLPPGLLTARRR